MTQHKFHYFFTAIFILRSYDLVSISGKRQPVNWNPVFKNTYKEKTKVKNKFEQ